MSERKLLDGNMAAVEALRLSRVGVISAYPITPQSPIAEKLSEYVADGTLKAKYIRVESEHSALSCAIGAQFTGIRTCTATSSVGLALMHEVLGVASGCRVPIVMPIINRSLVSPWSLWCDHQDSMAERDSGWIQLYAETTQEVLDNILMAFRLAEDPRVLTPAMVCLDGFFLSHTSEVVEVPVQEKVDGFLPPYQRTNLYLDPDDPMFINNLTPSIEFNEMRYQQKVGFDNALNILPQVQEEFFQHFGRKYQLIEGYRCEDAQVVMVTIGSMTGTAKHVVDEMRQKGIAVGVAKITCFRPFPVKEIQKILGDKKIIGVIDRSAGLGAEGGPVYTEVKAALANLADHPAVVSFIGGLGGRDLSPATIEDGFNKLLKFQADGLRPDSEAIWIDLKPEPLKMREVLAIV